MSSPMGSLAKSGHITLFIAMLSAVTDYAKRFCSLLLRELCA